MPLKGVEGEVPGIGHHHKDAKRVFIEWDAPRRGYTCRRCLHADHGLCNGFEQYAHGRCKCNICAKAGREKVRAALPRARRKPGPRANPLDPAVLERVAMMRERGMSWRECGDALGTDFSGLRRKFLAAHAVPVLDK